MDWPPVMIRFVPVVFGRLISELSPLDGRLTDLSGHCAWSAHYGLQGYSPCHQKMERECKWGTLYKIKSVIYWEGA